MGRGIRKVERWNRMKKLKKGYSLVEVLAAFAIISIAILPIMSMYPAIFKQNTSASQIEEASRTAMTIVDFIKAVGYSHLTSTATGTEAAFNVENGGGKIVDTSGSNPAGFIYTFKKESGAYITVRGNTNYALDNDLKFGGTTVIDNINNAFILLNAKGLNLSQCKLYIAMKQENVNLTTSSGALLSSRTIDPAAGNGITANTSETPIMYGNITNPERFIIGRVIIGWGNDITVTSPSTRQQRDQSLTGKEKVYGVNFVVTPIEN